jgi:hypothetical protein
MPKSIAFRREGRVIIAEVYSRYMEPLGKHTGYLEVLFCQDSDGHRYRVLKSDVLMSGTKPWKRPKEKRKAREKKSYG